MCKSSVAQRLRRFPGIYVALPPSQVTRNTYKYLLAWGLKLGDGRPCHDRGVGLCETAMVMCPPLFRHTNELQQLSSAACLTSVDRKDQDLIKTGEFKVS